MSRWGYCWVAFCREGSVRGGGWPSPELHQKHLDGTLQRRALLCEEASSPRGKAWALPASNSRCRPRIPAEAAAGKFDLPRNRRQLFEELS